MGTKKYEGTHAMQHSRAFANSVRPIMMSGIGQRR